MSTKDDIYSTPVQHIERFEFNRKVAGVFDDMIQRSVPGYEFIQDMAVVCASYFHHPASIIYDLGCATGETIHRLRQLLDQLSSDYRLIGVDNSAEMIEKAIEKCPPGTSIRFDVGDLRHYTLSPCSVVIMMFTLQFIREYEERINCLRNIYQALNPGGVLIIGEKIKLPPEQDVLIACHEQFKRSRHYSELEIRQKRDALEDTLIPLSIEDNYKLLTDAGFSNIVPMAQALNFAGFIAIK